MENIPQFPIPEGFAIRNYRRNEGHIWTRILQAGEPYAEIDDELFDREFKRLLSVMEDRSFLPNNGHRQGNRHNHGVVARYRWRSVGTDPLGRDSSDYQGRGLSKPMMTVAMERLKQSHERCFLGTSTGRMAAIKVYLDFGFTPDLSHENSQQAWTEVASVLKHPILKEFAV